MTEIAGDLGMSTANLYRYFESKQDLAGACCERWMSTRTEALRAVVRECPGTAVDRLREFVLTNLKITHQLASEQPQVSEMVEMITQNRRDLVTDKIHVMESLLAELLAFGNQTGEFAVEDVVATAHYVHAAILLYEVPLFSTLFTVDEFEASANGVVDLLVRGLAVRNP
jgi:AcrR family transcriptional regulator